MVGIAPRIGTEDATRESTSSTPVTTGSTRRCWWPRTAAGCVLARRWVCSWASLGGRRGLSLSADQRAQDGAAATTSATASPLKRDSRRVCPASTAGRGQSRLIQSP